MPRQLRPPLRRVAFATFRERPEITRDDRYLARALAARGVECEGAPWDGTGIRWGSFDLVLVRSTWNYYRHAPAFRRWVGSVARRTTLWNSPRTIRRNAHKGYLLELASKGIPIVPTRLLRRARPVTLTTALRATGWDRFVLKPAVGADRYGFLASDVDHLPVAERHLRALLRRGDVLLQPFRSAAVRGGERSFVYFGGRFSHCAEYPYLARHGVRRTRLLRPTAAERRVADAVVAASGEDLLYARADFMPTEGGGWELGELELIEPELLFRTAPSSARRLTSEIFRRWNRSPSASTSAVRSALREGLRAVRRSERAG